MLASKVDHAARLILMSCYLYYYCDSPVLNDGDFDSLCLYVAEHWAELTDLRKYQLGSPEQIKTSGFHVKLSSMACEGSVSWHEAIKGFIPTNMPYVKMNYNKEHRLHLSGENEMSIIDFEEEENKRRMDEYPKLRLLQGGKEPPVVNDYWLKDIEEHGVFIARLKKSPDKWIASEYHVTVKMGDAYKLVLVQWDPEKNKERIHYSWVCGPEFCKDWECIEVLDDGKSYRTDNEDGLEGHGDVQTDSTLDQDTGQEVVRTESGTE